MELAIGVLDWMSPLWTQTYYPLDLPPDWRAAYYANEYTCAGTSDLSLESIRQWGEDLPENFALWLCPKKEIEMSRLTVLHRLLGRKLKGVIQPSFTPARMENGLFIQPPWSLEAGIPAAVGVLDGRHRPESETRAYLEAFSKAPGPSQRQLLIEGDAVAVERILAMKLALEL